MKRKMGSVIPVFLSFPKFFPQNWWQFSNFPILNWVNI
jgi:hypothetical protein